MAEVASPAQDSPVVTFKKRPNKSKKNILKRPATPPPENDDSEYASSADEQGNRRVKRVKRNAGVDAGLQNKTAPLNFKPTEFAADTSSHINDTNDATATSNWIEGSTDAAAAALLGNTKKQPPPTSDADGTYKGQAAYTNHLHKNPDAPDKKIGPQKAASNVRTITVTDFAPDVCKDYKQTGFCGFGDSCKFLHMREDYKQGWQLDKDWEQVGDKQKKGKVVSSADRSAKVENADEADARMLENIPFVCIICKKDYKNPVVTKCGHYFCEKCALDRYRKTPKCAACDAGTNGVFNVARNLRKLLERKKEREERKKQERKDAGEEVISDEE